MKVATKGIFPSQAVPDIEKADPKYGLQVGKAIEDEWFKKDSGSTRYFANRDQFKMLKHTLCLANKNEHTRMQSFMFPISQCFEVLFSSGYRRQKT